METLLAEGFEGGENRCLIWLKYKIGIPKRQGSRIAIGPLRRVSDEGLLHDALVRSA